MVRVSAEELVRLRGAALAEGEKTAAFVREAALQPIASSLRHSQPGGTLRIPLCHGAMTS